LQKRKFSFVTVDDPNSDSDSDFNYLSDESEDDLDPLYDANIPDDALHMYENDVQHTSLEEKWCSDLKDIPQFPFSTDLHGTIITDINNESSPRNVFHKIFTGEIMEIITSATNAYARELYSRPVHTSRKSPKGHDSISDDPVGTTQKIVETLMAPYFDRGHHLFMDNFYNSVTLSEYLLSKKTHVTGTLRANRRHNPREVIEAKLRKGEHIWSRKKEVCGGLQRKHGWSGSSGSDDIILEFPKKDNPMLPHTAHDGRDLIELIPSSGPVSNTRYIRETDQSSKSDTHRMEKIPIPPTHKPSYYTFDRYWQQCVTRCIIAVNDLSRPTKFV
ncbi:hypothetical protein Bhyg_13545, partial [Pseudolycoriella hygida]